MPEMCWHTEREDEGTVRMMDKTQYERLKEIRKLWGKYGEDINMNTYWAENVTLMLTIIDELEEKVRELEEQLEGCTLGGWKDKSPPKGSEDNKNVLLVNKGNPLYDIWKDDDPEDKKFAEVVNDDGREYDV